jgi:hypothetical protein
MGASPCLGASPPAPGCSACCGLSGAEEEPTPQPPADQRRDVAVGVEAGGGRAQGFVAADSPSGATSWMRNQPRGCWRSSLLQLHLHHGEISVEWQWW